MLSQTRKRSLVGSTLVLALLLTALTMTPHRASALGTVHFIHVTTASNTSGNETFLNNPATNGRPNAILFVTHNFISPYYQFDPSPIGVWYDTHNNEWAIVNEDHSAIAIGTAFNVLVVPGARNSVFVHTATPSNIQGNETVIDNPLTNGNPSAQLLITQGEPPGGGGGIYIDPHTLGVYYDMTLKKWTVVNAFATSMPIGAAFNVLVGAGASGGGTELLQTATSSNTFFNFTVINTSLTNNDFNAVLFATENWDPGGIHSSPIDGFTTGVWLAAAGNQDEWAVFNEQTSQNMPVSAAFNVLAFAS